MRMFNHMKFGTKINLGIISIVVFVALILALTIGRLAARDLARESKKRGRIMVQHLANQAAEPMLSMDMLRLKNMVEELKRVDNDVEYAFILDARGNVLAHTFRDGFPVALKSVNIPRDPCGDVVLVDTGKERIYDFAACSRVDEDVIGTARVGLARHMVLQGVNQLMMAVAGIAAVALSVAVSLGAFFSGKVTQRLKGLQQQAAAMVKGELDHKAALCSAGNCWEFMNCGRTDCPVYGDTSHHCWHLRSACILDNEHPHEVMGETCRDCPMFRESKGDEIQDLADTFEFMALSLKAYIDDLKEAKERLLTQQDQLIQSQKMESLGKLAGGVAHEINTPLGIILGYAQLLQDDVDKDSQIHEDLQTIEKQTKVCRKIVSDLLGFSRQYHSQMMEICLNHTLLEVLSLMRNTMYLQDIEAITDLNENLPYIVADPEKLKQVWINLFSNAMDSMPGGGLLKLMTRINFERETVLVFVADTGSGISREDLSKVFDPFYTTKSVGKGTGLGLSVSFGIIDDHHGEILVNSPVPEGIITEEEAQGKTLGPGTLFTIELPLDASGPEEDFRPMPMANNKE